MRSLTFTPPVERVARELARMNGMDPDMIVSPVVPLRGERTGGRWWAPAPPGVAPAAAWTWFKRDAEGILEMLRAPSLGMRKTMTFKEAEERWPRILDAMISEERAPVEPPKEPPA